MVCGKEATTLYKLRAASDEDFFREHVITIKQMTHRLCCYSYFKDAPQATLVAPQWGL